VRRVGILAGPALTAIMALQGCAPGPMSKPGTAAPMNNPIPLGSESGSGAVESVRRQLFGTWELTKLEAAPESGAARLPIKAQGTLVYDEYGNLTIDARTTDANAPVAAREVARLSFKGRAVIDTVKSELKLMDVTGNVTPDEVLSPERRRRYTVDANTLTLSSFDEKGTVTAISTWRRRQ
jgi:hypothetical protein